METNTQQERAKRLEQQAREYLMQSNDPIFTRYLQQLLPRIQRQPEYVEQLQAELDKSVEFWYQRQQINANRGGETGAESSAPQQSVPQEAAAGEQQVDEIDCQHPVFRKIDAGQAVDGSVDHGGGAAERQRFIRINMAVPFDPVHRRGEIRALDVKHPLLAQRLNHAEARRFVSGESDLLFV